MGEFTKTTTEQALVINIIPQEIYDELKSISANQLLSGELSNQLFLTNGDATSMADVEGLPGEVVYFSNEGYTHGPILVRNGYVCETSTDLDMVEDAAGEIPGTSSEATVQWNGQDMNATRFVFPDENGNQSISCSFSGTGTGFVYGCLGTNEYGSDLGFGFFRTESSCGLFLDNNGDITPYSNLTASHSANSAHIVRTDRYLSVGIPGYDSLCVDLSDIIVPDGDENRYFSENPGVVGYMFDSQLTVACSHISPVSILSVDPATGDGIACRLDPILGEWTPTHQSLLEAGFLPGRLYRNEATEKTFFIWNEKIISIVGDQYASVEALQRGLATKLDLSSAPQYRGTFDTWGDVPTDDSGYQPDDNGLSAPDRNDFITVWEASAYNLNGYGPGTEKALSGAYRFIYNSNSWDLSGILGWIPQYQINEGPFSDKQMSAINSGIDAGRVATYDGYQAQIEARAYLSATSSDTQLSNEFAKYYPSSQTSSATQIHTGLYNKLDSAAVAIDWSEAPPSIYQEGDVVTYNGSIWRHRSTSTNDDPPSLSNADWQPLFISYWKQDRLTFDNAPTQDSGNPVKSGGVYTALQAKANTSDLPYRLVTPGKWEFSGEPEGWVVEESSMAYSDGNWTVSVTDGSEDPTRYDFEGSGSENATAVLLSISHGEDIITITATRASLPGHLLDRAVNAVPVSTDTTLTLPALEHAGKARDFLVRLEISGSTVPTITFAAPTGETITYETDGDEFPVPDAAGTWLYSFTETAAHTFAVALKSVSVVTQGGS